MDPKNDNLKCLQHYVHVHKIQVLIVEETYFTELGQKTERVEKYLHSKSHHHLLSSSAHRAGISIFSFIGDVKLRPRDFTTSSALASLQWKSLDFALAGIYFATHGPTRLEQISDFDSKLADHDFSSALLMGDFNFVPNPILDKINSSARNTNTTGLREFDATIATKLNLTDVWRDANPGKRGATCTSKSHRVVRTRLDRALASPDLTPFISIPRHIPFACSDHDGIFITISSPENANVAKPLHIFDDALLADDAFNKEMKLLFDNDSPDPIPSDPTDATLPVYHTASTRFSAS